jgi:hypothetical protein
MIDPIEQEHHKAMNYNKQKHHKAMDHNE